MLQGSKDVPVVAGFPITGDVRLAVSGEHRSLRYEVCNFARDMHHTEGRGTWAYYVYINELMLPADAFEEFWLKPSDYYEHSNGTKTPSYAYYETRWASVDWHGGVTFYEKHKSPDEGFCSVKIGCDYAHIWDAERGYTYDLFEVERDAHNTIDELHELYKFNARCSYSGVWLPPAQMVSHEGRVYTPEGLKEWLAWRNRSPKLEGAA